MPERLQLFSARPSYSVFTYSFVRPGGELEGDIDEGPAWKLESVAEKMKEDSGENTGQDRDCDQGGPVGSGR